jgi:hypothetical protein
LGLEVWRFGVGVRIEGSGSFGLVPHEGAEARSETWHRPGRLPGEVRGFERPRRRVPCNQPP